MMCQTFGAHTPVSTRVTMPSAQKKLNWNATMKTQCSSGSVTNLLALFIHKLRRIHAPSCRQSLKLAIQYKTTESFGGNSCYNVIRARLDPSEWRRLRNDAMATSFSPIGNIVDHIPIKINLEWCVRYDNKSEMLRIATSRPPINVTKQCITLQHVTVALLTWSHVRHDNSVSLFNENDDKLNQLFRAKD